MASDDKSKLDELALEFLKLIHDVIPWRDVPEDVRRDKWRVLAKRVMASSGEDLQEFMHNVVRGVAGDIFYVKRGVTAEGGEARILGKELEELLKKVHEKQAEKELLAYVKSRAIPLVIRLSARLGEEGEEGE
ncbi:hypothetical protein [Pyrodictium delaneyi]|uniref:Uncharacterized protein n=1 Tax=Pyrodictium delaneyi TaxID=1273541 RepID=A0A211YNV9_9CREN|nr:hypothetical protein [Pyrodictium delaneyi]OWJ54732.1 hypothetical protein Pdsh_03110 [Pyrodictium delaneyi]